MVKLYPIYFSYRWFFFLLFCLKGSIGLAQFQSDNSINVKGPDFVIGNKFYGHVNSVTVATTTWDGSNWDFGLPGPGINVVINGDYSGPGWDCANLILIANKIFAPNSSVHVKGNCISYTTQNAGHLIFDNNLDIQNIQGYFKDITIDNPMGALVQSNVFVRGTLQLQAGSLNASGGNLVIVSNASGTGRVGKVAPGCSIIGDVTVQRFIPGGQKGWYFLSSPVENQQRNNWSDGFTLTNSAIFLHNEAGNLNSGEQINGWEYLPSNNEVSLGRGYRTFLPQDFFTNGATLDNKGPLKTGDYSFSVGYNPATGYGGGGWNFIGNPYACEIDWHALTKTNIGGEYHVWNKTGYGSYSEGMGIGVNGPDRYIPSHQGFFVKANGAAPSLTITEGAKPGVPQNPGFLRIAANDPPDALRIKLTETSTGLKDETALRFMASTTGDFDPFFDAHKLPNDGIAIFSLTDINEKLSLQARPFVDGELINLGYKVKAEGSYMLRLTFGTDLIQGKNWFLRDNLMGTIHPLTANYVHPFVVNDGIFESTWRFSIFGVSQVLENSFLAKEPDFAIFPNPASAALYLIHTQKINKVCLYDAHGRRVLEMENIGGLNQLKMILGDLPNGVYQLVAEKRESKISERLLIQK